MTVYVDEAKHAFGRMIMCHMWADSDAELLEMADKIGVQRKWIQGHPELSFGKHKNASWVHFDIAKGKRDLAIQNGAIVTDKYGPVEHCAKLHIASGDPALVARGTAKLDQVRAVRAMKENAA